MTTDPEALALLARLEWRHVLLILGILAGARLLSGAVTRGFTGLAGRAPAGWRLRVLRFMPVTRFLVALGALLLILPLLVRPTAQSALALLASVGLALAFVLKDYGSSIVAALVTVFEHPYQPGDWIAVEGTYGEVRFIGLRAVHLLTPDDTEVIVPHSKLWGTSIFNATAGQHHVLCVADFYLHPEHDGARVQAELTQVASASPYRKPESPVTVIAAEKPWGTHYRLKAYARESRDQFLFTTDLTLRGKAALLALGVKPALATYAEGSGGSDRPK